MRTQGLPLFRNPYDIYWFLYSGTRLIQKIIYFSNNLVYIWITNKKYVNTLICFYFNGKNNFNLLFPLLFIIIWFAFPFTHLNHFYQSIIYGSLTEHSIRELIRISYYNIVNKSSLRTTYINYSSFINDKTNKEFKEMVIATIILVCILQFWRWKQYGKVLKLFLTCYTWIYKSKIIKEIEANIKRKLRLYYTYHQIKF